MMIIVYICKQAGTFIHVCLLGEFLDSYFLLITYLWYLPNRMTVELKRSLQSVNHVSRKAETQPQCKYIGPPSCLLCLATGRTWGEESVRTEKGTEMGKSKRKRKKGNLRNQYTPLFRGFTAYHPRVFQFDFEFPFLYLFLFETLL